VVVAPCSGTHTPHGTVVVQYMGRAGGRTARPVTYVRCRSQDGPGPSCHPHKRRPPPRRAVKLYGAAVGTARFLPPALISRVRLSIGSRKQRRAALRRAAVPTRKPARSCPREGKGREGKGKDRCPRASPGPGCRARACGRGRRVNGRPPR
jgi:hypothetical protein